MRLVTALIDRSVRISNATDYTAEQQMRVLADYTLPAMKRRLLRAAAFLVAETPVWASADKVLTGVLVALRTPRASADDVAVIEALFVDPSVQGMGVGGALLDELVERAQRAGIERITVAASLTAVDFYAHMGFSRAGRGLSNTGVETVMMERHVR
ncbi:MAG: GNAT family N-acetyltransferase [Bosea sp. (in: a-proteobacteria)]